MALDLTIKFGFGVDKLNCEVANDIAGKRVRTMTRNINKTALELARTERDIVFCSQRAFSLSQGFKWQGVKSPFLPL